jgi:hypothetical protein
MARPNQTHATYVYKSDHYVHEGEYGARTASDVGLAFKTAREFGFEVPSEIRVYDFEADTMTSYWPNGSKRESALNGNRPNWP